MTKDTKHTDDGNVVPFRPTSGIGRPTVVNPGEYAARIRHCRKAAGLNQVQLANMIGITSGSIANWENGVRRPDIDMLKRLCVALDISADELLGIGHKNKLPSDEEMQFLKCCRSLTRHDRVLLEAMIDKMLADSYEEFRRTYKTRFFHRLYSPLRVCAGTGVDLSDGGEMNRILVRNTDETYACDEILTITGNSMEPEYHDRDRVLVKHTASINPGEVGIFVIAGEGVMKVYQKDGLYPLNPAFKVIHPKEDDNVRCVGRVIGVLTPDMLPTRDEQIMIDELNAENRE